MRRHTVLLHTSVAVALLPLPFLTGCGGGSASNSVPPSVASTPSAAPPPPNPAPAPTPAPTPTPIGTLVVSPAAASLLPSATLTLSAGINGVPATDVTWSLLENSAGSITAAGTYTAPATSGTYHVRATSKLDGTIFAEAVISVAPALSANPVWVMGYYVGYHSSLQTPAQVDYSSMTHILIGAAEPRSDGSFDTTFFIDAVNGPIWARETVQRAHAAGTKAILMLGGAGFLSGFRATSDPAVRSAFVNNLKAIVSSYGFDGIDLDWEPMVLPGPGDPATPDDRPAVRALVQALHAALPNMIYTIPVGWNNANFNGMAHPFYGELSASFDRINMMSYEMIWLGSGWESWHSSALYGSTGSTPSSIDNTAQALQAAGVPKSKIGIGIGFYGAAYEQGTWLNNVFVHATEGQWITDPHQNTDNAHTRFSDNDVSYSNLMRYYYDAAAEKWDATAQAPYLSWATPKTIVGAPPAWASEPIKTSYVTYENARSIAGKGAYVRQQGLGGTIIWTISEGYLGWQAGGEKDPLMKAVKTSFGLARVP